MAWGVDWRNSFSLAPFAFFKPFGREVHIHRMSFWIKLYPTGYHIRTLMPFAGKQLPNQMKFHTTIALKYLP